MKIRDKIDELDYLVHGPFDEFIRSLQEIKKRYEEAEWENLTIDYDYYGYDGGKDLVLYGLRDETWKEENARLERERKTREREKEIKAKKLETEKKEYERLKKKFGGK